MVSLSWDGGLTFWTLITFACLFFLLARYAFKPLSKLLEERERKILGAINQAEKAKAEAEALLNRNEEQLNQAREETRRIINEGHRMVGDMKRESQQRAKVEADALIEQARQEIDREMQRGLDELKGTVANLSIRIARQVIRSKVDEEEHARLADEFVERLKASHAGRKP